VNRDGILIPSYWVPLVQLLGCCEP
jgi:hypothetical protein